MLLATTTLCLSAIAQTNIPTAMPAHAPFFLEPGPPVQIFRMATISRSTQALNYQHRSGATKVDFKGTELMPLANGQAKVESKRGAIEIEVEFANLQTPTTFGSEYLTYVLWAISPEGRASNLGEVLVGENHRSKLDVTTEFQSFAMLVTAEPYYAVRQPSNVVVLENVIRTDTKATEAVSATYELMERGGYIPTGYTFDPVVLDARVPLEFLEARNAVRIAELEGAGQYANDSFQHALQLMKMADGYVTDKRASKKQLIATSRETVQTAEDARAIAIKNRTEESLAKDRAASMSAQAKSQAQANHATLERDAAQAEAAQSRLNAEQAQQATAQAQDDRAKMRARLSQQLNDVLQTRDSARGLIVNMSDVLFDTGRYSLKSEAREKLAKVSGILLSYTGLSIQVSGYTDNIGGDVMNQELSENRAGAVRDYLVQEGVATGAVSAKGFGSTIPVASNDTSAGRQQNRRVELLVSGDTIGGTTSAMFGGPR
ncbi:OmpA family protein [Terriglobus albidus]|uniref:OmpA family protein n=1 Tax=Terriglobus albidus TaxID=1592106 RepID=A0A5B9EFK3_9BACT|nr:OmpA family protein [Terriglobus albidus]QEE30434.1 OmpA family protein [Terriglobus albidus]